MTTTILLAAAAGGLGLYASALAYVRGTIGVCKSDRDLKGKTVIVTGGNGGIGLETARDLAARNARVILACRSVSKAEEAAKDIIRSTGNSNVLVKQLDVSSFQSVKDFAKDILKTENRLDVLVNNAGVMILPKPDKSEDGLEMIMATNHFGPFLLTNLLLPILQKSAPSRIVVVSSLLHEWAELDVDDLACEKKSYSDMNKYGKSKLANVLFTRELSERLKNTGVTVNALHPGAVKTDLARNMRRYLPGVTRVFLGPFIKTPKEGAQTSIYVAVSEELKHVTGKYFSDCREKKLKKHALDQNTGKKLWEYSEKITKLADSL